MHQAGGQVLSMATESCHSALSLANINGDLIIAFSVPRYQYKPSLSLEMTCQEGADKADFLVTMQSSIHLLNNKQIRRSFIFGLFNDYYFFTHILFTYMFIFFLVSFVCHSLLI